MENILQTINAFLWGIPVLLLILIVGIYLTIRSHFAQFRLFPSAMHHFIESLKKPQGEEEGTSGYRALCTALAATVGTGNIAGVAGAIALGGPGVVFWMWVCALLGMVTKLAEVTLALHYRSRDCDGKFLGGPMYIIDNGLPPKFKFLSFLYCFFCVVAAFGVGNATQINTVINSAELTAETLNCTFDTRQVCALGLILAVLVTVAFRNNGGRIGAWAEKLVPFASVIYILLSAGVLLRYYSQVPGAIMEIISGAFSPKTATCGVISSVLLTLRVGASRGVFTNEAGMGTASIAHAAANVKHPVEQGLMGIMEVFLDTVVICTLTALVILCSGVPIPYGSDPGITLTMDAFSKVYGDWSILLISALVSIFAFATILGWGLYGSRCAQYLFGKKAGNVYMIAQAGGIMLGALLNTSVVWVFSEIVNGLMAIPNLIALVLLSPVFIRLCSDCLQKKKAYRP